MAGMILVYGLCGVTGAWVERRWPLDCLLGRVVLIGAIAAAELMFLIQLLSVLHWLTGPRLILASFLCTLAVVGLTARQRRAEGRASWRRLLSRRWAEVATLRKTPLVLVLAGASMAFFLVGCLAGLVMIPSGDSYHYEMPLFWAQNRSVLPFPVHNPRIVSLAFLSEALSLPAVLFARSPSMPAVLTLAAGLLCLWVVFSLARRSGAGLVPSICAAAICVGYTQFALEPLVSGADAFLAGAWTGASLVFLMDARAASATSRTLAVELGCSVFCFLLACGAKNTTALLAPFYLGSLGWVLARKIREAMEMSKRQRAEKRGTQASASEGADGGAEASDLVARCAAPEGGSARWTALLGVRMGAWAVAGLLCSGVVWNHAANRLWFGNSTGPGPIAETVARDFRPRAIWTRLCRGAVLVLFDTVWIPGSAREAYASACQTTVKALGGEATLAEDDGYYSFDPEALTPRKGLGLLGLGIFLPGVLLATSRRLRRAARRRGGTPHCRATAPADAGAGREAHFNTALLVVMTCAAFVMCHLILRWQRIGVLRLMFPFVVVGAPLGAALLERKWARGAALALLLVSCAMFLTLWLGNISRRTGWSAWGPLTWIAPLQNDHRMQVRYRYRGEPAREFVMREDYSYREVYDRLLAGISQPATIGFVGPAHAECGFLFGRRFENRVVPLVDGRAFEKILEPLEDLDYVVTVDRFAAMEEWATARGFERLFEAANAHGKMLVAFEKLGRGKL